MFSRAMRHRFIKRYNENSSIYTHRANIIKGTDSVFNMVYAACGGGTGVYMAGSEALSGAKSSLILENRQRLMLTGVKEVVSFSDTAVALKTVLGDLAVQGKKLNISKLNTDTSELFVSGEISLIKYSRDKSRGGFFEGLFK